MGPVLKEMESLKKHWGWLLVTGLVLLIVGLLAIGACTIATLATVMIFGVLILIGGAVHLLGAFRAHQWRGVVLHVLAGVLYVVVGVVMVEHPTRAAAAITLMIAVLFFVGGLLRVILAVTQRFAHWGWMLFSGLISLLLGVLIWRQWPLSGLWIIGLFVGIEMVLNGCVWILLALAARKMPVSESQGILEV
jgi:uncharacterized membrane protein HdeD (DUF308 family)